MKKYILSLLVFFSIPVMAMVEQTAVFDFSNLNSLNATPPLTGSEINKVTNLEAGIGLNVTSRSFSEGLVSLSFPNTSSSGAGLAHYGNAFSLNIGPLTTIKFAVSGGCEISKITFNSPLGVYSVSAGRMSVNRTTWEASGDQVSELTIKVGNNNYEINKITVNYLRPSTPINFISSSPKQSETVDGSFKAMTMTFSSTVTQVNNASNIKLTGKDTDGTDINQTMTVSTSGSSVTLTAPTAITKDADLKVTVPAGTVQNSEGAVNMEDIVVSFKVMSKRDTFNPTKIEPEAGTWNELPKEIRLTFPNFVKAGTGSIMFRQADGTLSFSVNVANVTVNNNMATITHDHTVVDAGQWTVEIPAKAFHNDFSETDAEYRWNAAQTINYVIDGSAAGPQDSQTMKDAKNLLKQTGIGYPKSTDPAWIALNNLVNQEDTPTDDVLAAAMTTLYNATDVLMPEVGKWYYIAGVNKAGKLAFMGYDNETDKVKLTSSQSTALAYMVSDANGNTIVFETKDGRFLHVPSALPNYGKTSTGSNLTDEQSELNNLVFSKFSATDVTESESTPSELFGKFTIQGKLDKNEDDGTTPTVFARFSYDGDVRISTTASEVPLAFTDAKSNAFILVETTEPVSYVDIIYPRIAFRNAVISNAGDEMLLVVHGPASTTIANPSMIYYTKSTSGADNEQRVTFSETILSPTDDPNTFSVNTVGLPAGEYNIVIENGALEYTAPEGKSIRGNGVLSAIFTIQGSTNPQPGQDNIEPTVSLSRTNLYSAGDELTLTIGNINKAILKNPSAPYFVYGDGEKAGTKVDYAKQILTSKGNSSVAFYVETSGLEVGNYTLIMPTGTFIYEAADANKNITDKQLSVSFSISHTDLPPTEFNEILTNVSFFNPNIWNSNSIVYKDIVLNDLIVYAYKYIVSQLVPGTGKVKIVGPWGNTIREGKLVAYPNIQKELGGKYEGLDFSEVTALRFIPDTPIIAGELDNKPATYGFGFEVAAFGDANYGKWLANPNSIAANKCMVNPSMSGPTFQINNATGYDPTTGIMTITQNDNAEQVIYDLQGRRVTAPVKKGIYIINGKKTVIK